MKTLVVVIYSPPGIGKSSMGFTAEKPLLLDFDKGSHRSKNRKDVVQIETWGDVTEMKAEDLEGYSTVVVDTAGRALDVLATDIIKADPKMGRGGALSLQGYGQLKSKFTAWVKLLRSFGKDIVLLAHSDESRSGDEVIERLDVQGGSKGEIYKSADVMGRIYLANGRRTLNLSPTDTAFGKNPGQLAALEVPDYATTPDFLAGVIKATKVALNTLSEEQAFVAAALAEWSEKIGAAVELEHFNALVEPAKAADEAVRANAKRLLLKMAKEHGFEFDGKTGQFVGPAGAAKPVVAPKAEREPGDDTDDETANRKAAEPTAAELEKLGQGALPGVTEKASKKTKAAA